VKAVGTLGAEQLKLDGQIAAAGKIVGGGFGVGEADWAGNDALGPIVGDDRVAALPRP
jgi:hypothetical protein